MNQGFTAAVTLLALLLYLIVSLNVMEARRKYEVRAPATTGNEHFERAYRVQMNTVEQMAFFLPSLWLCAIFLSDLAAAIGGIVWIAGRALVRPGVHPRPRIAWARHDDLVRHADRPVSGRAVRGR